MRGERLRLKGPVMPVGNHVDRANGAALLAGHTRSEHRPRKILRQRIEPDVYAVSIAFPGSALHCASDVTFGKPFSRAAKRPPLF